MALAASPLHSSSSPLFPFQLVDIQEDDFLSLMDDGCNMKEDLKLPTSDLGKEIRTKHCCGDSCLVRMTMITMTLNMK